MYVVTCILLLYINLYCIVDEIDSHSKDISHTPSASSSKVSPDMTSTSSRSSTPTFENLHAYLCYDYKAQYPHDDIINSAKISQAIIQQGYRPSLPESIPSTLKHLIESCWEDAPTKRPSFTAINSLLQGPIHDQVYGDSKSNLLNFSISVLSQSNASSMNL